MALPSWLASGVTTAISGVANTAADIVDRFVESPDEKRQLKALLAQKKAEGDAQIEQTIRKGLESRERIIVAEMNQDDNYTKRARPTLVYAGLGMIFLNYVLFPNIAALMSVTNFTTTHLPVEFWVAWGGTVGIWSLGRSAERRGATNAVVKKITGSKSVNILGD
jgi:hypothetical protein